ncbi:MAG: acetylxylan esterase [Armatimonadota bacterium]
MYHYGSAVMLMMLIAVLLFAITEVSAASKQLLVPKPGGGWQTAGLPYTAVISAQGTLESIVVSDYNFLTAHGLFLAKGDTLTPATVKVDGDTAVLENANGRLTLRFLPERIEMTLFNIDFADGNCARMEVNKGLTRIKSPGTGVDYPLPPTLIGDAMRLIAPSGASLTLPGQYLYPQGKNYYMKLPWARPGGPEAKFTFDISPAFRIEDQVKVSLKAKTEDFTYWSGDPQPFYTELTNMLPDRPFRGTLVMRLQAYLTKAYVKELRQPVTLGKGEKKTLTWILEKLEPGTYIAEIWVERGKERGLCCRPRFVYHASALMPAPLPEDFDAFWKQTLDEQARVPMDLQITKVKDIDKLEVYKFSFAGLLNRRIYGYLTVPKDKTKKYPAILIVPSSGEHGIAIPSRGNDTVAMAINISNLDVDLPEDKYDWRTWPAPYLVTGILEKEYYTLRFSYAGIVRAAEMLAARPEVQADNILCYGSSQGGGLTIIAAGLYPKFKAAVANVPALCRIDWSFDYWNPPYFPIAANADTRPMISRTLKYFDATQFARKINCPIWISLGLMDDVTPSMGVFCAYNAIPAKQKTLQVLHFGGHGGGCTPESAKGVWP